MPKVTIMQNINYSIAEQHTPVLIVGGGISGLTASLFLLKHGITPLVVERHRGTSVHPRARGFDVRTMELYRELKIDEDLREAGKALSPSWGIHTARSVASLVSKKKPKNKDKPKSPSEFKGLGAVMALSPETGCRCTQDLAEPILLQTATSRGADIRFYTEMTSFSQDENGVTAIIKDRESGLETTIKADYMIAADGAKSIIREALNAETIGAGPLGNLLNIYFETDLADVVRGREFSLLRIEEPDLKGLFTSINNSNKWVFHLHYDADNGERPEDYTHERIVTILERVIGIPGIKIRVISVLPWQPTVRALTDMQHGRIFFAGDAAHTMTPYGGKGANSGIQDVHNLAWKLASVLQGNATPELLKTYSPERQPVGWYNAEQSGKMANEYGIIKKRIPKFFVSFLSVMILGFLKLTKVFPKVPLLQLGYLLGIPEFQYASSAVITEGAPVAGYHKVGLLNGLPGTRMPHFWAEHAGAKISSLDMLGEGFVLFTGSDNAAWKKAAAAAGKHFAINIPVYSIGEKGDLVYTDKLLSKILEINEDGAVLVRPDGFVAWRSAELPASALEELNKVLRKILIL